ncbi:glycosyltransferase family 4 protein [Candidatus Dependentiae bacterium]
MINKKKILYIHHGKGLGGAPLSLLYLIESLDKDLYDPVVLFLQDSEVIDLYKSKGIKTFGPLNLLDFPHSKIRWYRWYHPHLFLKTLFDSFKTYCRIAEYWFDKIKPNFVHLNTSSLTIWAKIAKNQNIPIVFHVREPLSNGYLGLRKMFITKLVAQNSDFILPICKNDAKPWGNNTKVNIVYNAASPKKFNKNINYDDFLIKHNLKKDSPRILFVGGLSREKGTLIILKAFKKLLKIMPRVQLLVAGYFDLRLKSKVNLKRYFPAQRYKFQVKKALGDINESIVFLGAINNVPQAIAASNIIVFPASQGHFARPIIEAGFMAKPVVASNLPPMDELVINNKTGFLVDPFNYEDWMEKLHALIINKKLNQKMGQAAFDYCCSNFDVNDQIVKIEKIYKKIGI